jgi:hypothetical protein
MNLRKNCISGKQHQKPQSVQLILAVIDNLPYCHSAELKDKVLSEWQVYQEESISEDLFALDKGVNDDGSGYVKYKRIDEYWQRVMQIVDGRGQPKYSTVGAIIKEALSLSHGQADVEHGFSVNKQVLNGRTALSARALCGTRTLKEVITSCGSILNIPITPALISAYRNAHKQYKQALEEEKTEKAKEALLGKRKMPVDDAVSQIKVKKLEWEEKQQQAEKLVSEGTERLSVALKSGKVVDALPAQALLETGNKLLKECRQELSLIKQRLMGGQHQPNKNASRT